MNKILITTGILALIGVGLFFFANSNLNEFDGIGVVATSSAEAVDVIGSKSGTTTTGVALTVGTATATYPVLIKEDYNAATFTFVPTAVLVTPSVTFNILGSNDRGCDTATTTGYGIYKNQINWVDVGKNLLGLSGSTTINTGTTTFSWTPGEAKQGKSITLTNLNFRCLGVSITGSSTSLWVQVKPHKR